MLCILFSRLVDELDLWWWRETKKDFFLYSSFAVVKAQIESEMIPQTLQLVENRQYTTWYNSKVAGDCAKADEGTSKLNVCVLLFIFV